MATEFVFDSHGTGDPILFVHGLGGTNNVFMPQADALGRHFRVLRPLLPAASTVDALVGHLLAFVDHEALSSFHLVGHSMGTIVCQHLAVRCPDCVRSLALIGPLAAPPEPARPALRDRAVKARAEGMTAIADAIVQGGISATTRHAHPEVAAFVRELVQRQNPETYASHCLALADAQAADVASLSCPVLLLTGNDDSTSPPAAARELARRFPQAMLEIIPSCGHWATLESPAAVNAALANFYFRP